MTSNLSAYQSYQNLLSGTHRRRMNIFAGPDLTHKGLKFHPENTNEHDPRISDTSLSLEPKH